MSFSFNDTDLGGTMEFLKAFSEIARAVGGRGDFDDLMSVIDMSDQDLSPEYVAAVSEQAAELLSVQPELSSHALWVLEQLTS